MGDLRGIDISKWQAVTPFLGGLSFLFARASIGGQRDERYSQHITNARRAGLVVGAYHFGINADGASQARTFLAAAGKVDLYVLDLEAYKVDATHRSKMTPAQARAFIAVVKAAGHKIGLYHSDSGFPDVGQSYNWVAKWSPVPPIRDWSFWQYRGSPLDLDRFAGTPADLAKIAGRPPTAPPTVWGPDVDAGVRAVDPIGKRVLAAVRRADHDPGTVVNLDDLKAAMKRAHHDYGTVVDPSDVRWLLDWSGGH